MEQSTLGILSLYALLGMAIAILWLRHQQVLRQRDSIADRVGSLEGDLNSTTQRLDLLSRGVDTVFGETPELHGLLGVHRSLETAESLLFEQAVGVSSSESCASQLTQQGQSSMAGGHNRRGQSDSSFRTRSASGETIFDARRR